MKISTYKLPTTKNENFRNIIDFNNSSIYINISLTVKPIYFNYGIAE